VSGSLPHRNKVLRLRPYDSPADEPATQTAIRVRTQLSLLQGYADIMEGLSPALKTQILRVIAEKTRALGAALQPFTEQAATDRPALGDYRRVRERTRHLMTEYRLLLERLQDRVSEAHEHVAGAGETLS
jgi:hypothetical protein